MKREGTVSVTSVAFMISETALLGSVSLMTMFSSGILKKLLKIHEITSPWVLSYRQKISCHVCVKLLSDLALARSLLLPHYSCLGKILDTLHLSGHELRYDACQCKREIGSS